MKRRDFILKSSMLGIAPIIPNHSFGPNRQIIKPRAFPKNGTVQLITPASALKRSVFEKTLENMVELGIKVKYSDNVRVSSGFLSGTDEQRLQDLHEAFLDDTVDAIWCARGGYGTGRLLKQLDYNLIKNNPKIFIGFSDITALLFAFYQRSGLVGFHGPVGASSLNDFTTDCLFDLIQKGKKIKIKNNDQNPLVGGSCEGRLIGGNLSLITSLVGTPYDVNFDGHILFLEEIGESTYRVDRMLTQLINAGKLDQVKGIALGHFTNCDTKESDPYYEFSTSLDEVFRDRLEDLGVPVVSGFPVGHEDHNATLPIGIMAELNADKGHIKLLEDAVV